MQNTENKNENTKKSLKEFAMELNEEVPARRPNGKTYKKEEIEVMSETACAAIIRNIKEQKQRKNTRFANRQELEACIDAFWVFVSNSWEQNVQVKPSIELFCSHAGISRLTYKRWMSTDYQGFAEALSILETNIGSVVAQLAMDGKMPPVVFATIMNNNHGYQQNNKIEITNNSGSDALLDKQAILEQVEAIKQIEQVEDNDEKTIN